FNYIIAGLSDSAGHHETAFVEHGADIGKHMGAAAKHGAISLGIQRWKADVVEKLAGFDHIGNPPLVAEGLAGDRWIVDKLFANDIAKIFVLGQFILDIVGI